MKKSGMRFNIMNRNLIKYFLIIVLMIGGCSSDFHTKKWAEKNLKGSPPVTLIKNILDLRYSQNRGMVFGILDGKIAKPAWAVLLGLRIIILIFLTIFIWIRRKQSFVFLLPFILFWAGAIGNLIDPFVYGYVVDFIYLRIGNISVWPFIFNLADLYVSTGAVIIFIYIIFFKGRIFNEKKLI